MDFKIWWKKKRSFLANLLLVTGAVSSVAALLLRYLPPPDELPWWVFLLLSVSVAATLLILVVEYRSGASQKIYRISDTIGIRRYMHRWIEHGGRVAIWTRDMSWAQNEETQLLLLDKAARGELVLFMPEVTTFASELAAAGADVRHYGASRLEAPSSRFTITSFGRGGAQVAVGHPEGDLHVIDEFKSDDHPAYYMADDLVKIVTALNPTTSI